MFSQHCKSCRTAGIDEEKIAAIPHWSVTDCFSAIERAVLAYTDALVYAQGRVPDGVFAALQEGLSDEEILELTDITALCAPMRSDVERSDRSSTIWMIGRRDPGAWGRPDLSRLNVYGPRP